MFVIAELASPEDVVDFPHVFVNALPVAQLCVADLAGELLVIGLVPTGLVLAQTLNKGQNCQKDPVCDLARRS